MYLHEFLWESTWKFSTGILFENTVSRNSVTKDIYIYIPYIVIKFGLELVKLIMNALFSTLKGY